MNNSVKNLSPYQAIAQPWWRDNQNDYSILSWNECLTPPTPLVRQKLVQFLDSPLLSYYPDVEAISLRQRLAEYTGKNFEEILVFGGSDAALEYICRCYLNSGSNAIFAGPTYDNMRVYAESTGAQVNKIINNENIFQLPVSMLKDAIDEKTSLVYLVSPNNPTGQIWSTDEISQICEKSPTSIVVVDEAYYEFCGESAAPLLDQYNNLIIARTFSKAFGLAGFRCGYTISSKKIVDHINKIKVGKNVSVMAQIAAEACLEDIDYMKNYVADSNDGKQWLSSQLHTMGISHTSTPANFILLKFDYNSRSLQEKLAQQGVYVRRWSDGSLLNGYIRVTTGPMKHMKKFIEALKTVLQKD